MGYLYCPESEFNLKYTLSGGQSFRWKETSPDNWVGVFAHKVWKISRDKDRIVYEVFSNDKSSKASINKKLKHKKLGSEECNEISETDEKHLINYLRLNTSLKELYNEWSESDPKFKEVCQTFQGIRILKQDPVENVFSFICSSNNNISRISSMVEKLCKFYGEKICDIDGNMYYDFPKLEALAEDSVEARLREAGFGYRAKFIQKSAKLMVEFGGETWLDKLSGLSYKEAKTELMMLNGVGAKSRFQSSWLHFLVCIQTRAFKLTASKTVPNVYLIRHVADCICLMSLGHLNAIPVDTHVFQIARYYLPHLKSAKSVTTTIYDEIGDHFRNLYGSYAGWAHSILFCADLKKFNSSAADADNFLKRKALPDKDNKSRKTAKLKK